jgi:hypothetical protein
MLASLATKLLAVDSNTTREPSADNDGKELSPVLAPIPALMRMVVLLATSRRNTSLWLGSVAVSVVAWLPNATNAPSSEIVGHSQSASLSAPSDERLTRVVVWPRAGPAAMHAVASEM